MALGDWGKNVTVVGVGAPLLRCRARRIQTEAKEPDTQSLGQAVVGVELAGVVGHRKPRVVEQRRLRVG